MSNSLAVATISAALKQRVQEIVNTTNVPNPQATTDRPDHREKKAGAGVNIFLYSAAPNPAWRGDDLPAFRGNGNMLRRPRAALDLYYLLGFYGDENVLEPQRLMGAVVGDLHARPTLTPQEITKVVSPSSPPPSTDPAFFLGASDLGDEVERVRFTPHPLTIEELSKLWSVLFQTPYSLSVAYQATVVFIEVGGTPRPALPVRDRNLYVTPFVAPRIARVLSAVDADLPILPGAPISIEGSHLLGDITGVQIAGTEFTPALQDMTSDRIKVTPPPTIAAGVRGLQVTHKVMMGTPATAHHGPESNVVAFALEPRIKNLSKSPPMPSGPLSSTDITIQAEPTLREGQKASLLLNHAVGGGAYQFDLPPLAVDTATVVFSASDLEAGPYYVRLRVDGAESTLLDVDPTSPTFKSFVSPQMTIP